MISINGKEEYNCKRKNNRKIGEQYERTATEYLENQGYEILKHNFRCRLGEIDIIAREADCLVFVEVKFRSRTDYGYPSDAVNRKKQMRISNAASYYIWKNFGNGQVPCRFDVVSIQGKEITLYRDAYSYCGSFL